MSRISSNNTNRRSLPVGSVIRLDVGLHNGRLCVKFSSESQIEGRNWRFVDNGNSFDRESHENYPSWELVCKPEVVEPENVAYVIDREGSRWNRMEDGKYADTTKLRAALFSFEHLVGHLGPVTPFVQKFEELPPVG